MNNELVIYGILCVLRIVLTLIPQYGYIHPDEHFQGPEVVYGLPMLDRHSLTPCYYRKYPINKDEQQSSILHKEEANLSTCLSSNMNWWCDIAKYKVWRTWDFSPTKPIRSIVFPYSVTAVPAIIINLLTLLNFNISSYLLLILPRLLMCIYSFLQDVCIYQICSIMKTDYKPCLILFASSYVTLSYLTRTFSNSLESTLFALFLFFSFKSLKLFQKTIYSECHELLFDVNYDVSLRRFTFFSFISSVILVLGCFIRPTFICFAIFPMIIWCFILYRVSTYAKINIILSIILGTFSMCICLIAIDTFYYNKIHYSTIKNFDIMCAPINFITYNLNPANLKSHGLHPRWLHALINVPLLFSVYGVILLLYFFVKFHYLFNGLRNSFEKLLFLSFVGPLILLSAIPHQEPRFIIPLIIPLSLLCNFQYFRTVLSNKLCVYIWVISNIFCLLFYGFIHQAGVYLSINYLNNIVENRNVVIFYKNYMPPRYLFHLSKSARTCSIYDFTEFEIDEFESRMQDIILNNKPLKVFIVLPYTILKSDLTFEALTISGYKFSEKITIFPHLSTENLPSFSELLHIVQNNSSFIKKLHEIQEIFSIHIISFQKYFS